MMLQSTPSLSKSIRSFWIYHVISGFFVAIECTLVVPPDHVIVLLNQEARITCTTDFDYSVVWYFASTKPGGPSEDIYAFGTFSHYVQGRYNINNSPQGRHDLLIEKSDPDHAGRYVCKDNEGLGEQLPAELIVLDNEPHCHVVRIKDERFIRCNVSYTGNLIPTIRCNSTSGDVVRDDNLSVQITPTTDVDSCVLCFQTGEGKCVNRTIVVDDPPITAESKTDERSTTPSEVDRLSKHVIIIAVVGTIVSVFLSLAVICGVMYYRRNCTGQKKSPLPSEGKMLNQSDSIKHSDHTNHSNHTNHSDHTMDHSPSGNKSGLLETTECPRAVDAERGHS